MLWQVRRRLGHANPNVRLNAYVRLFNKDDREAALAIEAAM
jgi:integrase